ncbi:MAG: COG4705 family protein [Pseudonocardiaceae bacterium]
MTINPGRVAAAPRARQMLNKVPEVTIYFWVIKVLATTVGETAADFLNTNLGLGLTGTSLVMSALLILVLFFQFGARQYVPGIYWLAVVLISVVGTLITDNLTDNFGVSLETTTVVFSVALAATFAAWYGCEKTLSIHTIYTTRREGFYWLTILFTFALGTAAGDLAAERLNLGYWISAIIFGGLIASVAVAHFGFKLNVVLAFWIAYILTRPLGASSGDYLSQPSDSGGLGLGTATTSALFLLTILSLVTYLTITRKDVLPTPNIADGQEPTA